MTYHRPNMSAVSEATAGSELRADRRTYAGLFMITLATLMYEILLTRIFSVTMWYHFAFVAVSVALFGMTLGALLVYLIPAFFTQERTQKHLAQASLAFSISIVVSFMVHASLPFVLERSLTGLFAVAFNYVVISIPFVFSGIAVCLSLTRYPAQVSRLYAADLAGAAIGCILLIYLLEVTDAPTGVFAIAAAAALGAALFSRPWGSSLARRAVAITVLLAVFAAGHTVLVEGQRSLVRLMWVKGRRDPPGVYETWNSFSRVKVYRDNLDGAPRGWGLSPVYDTDKKVPQYPMDIDATAATVLTKFDGDTEKIDYLRYDLTNLVYYMRDDADVLVVGMGGGRDVLAALAFDQAKVTAVELNGDIIEAVNGRFGEFTGHLDQNPRVRLVVDEARSFVARSPDRYDVIQISFIDTWAATGAGAFVLSENGLYTKEAMNIFLDHLSDEGILSLSRWWYQGRPSEIFRMTSLIAASLRDRGIERPWEHMAVIRSDQPRDKSVPPVGTVLVGARPFNDAELDRLEEVSASLEFRVVLSSRGSTNDTLTNIVTRPNLSQIGAALPIDISPPTDDDPFFFNMLKFRHALNPRNWGTVDLEQNNLKAVSLLLFLLVLVLGLTFLCIVVPLWKSRKRTGVNLKGSTPLFVFFIGIGLGFLLIEISQMQRLTLFLGHPVYGLAVVLFSLLLSAGLGSFTTQKVGPERLRRSGSVRLGVLLVALAIFGFATPSAVRAFEASTTPIRIAVATGILFPLGFLMGMAFPLGMKAASARFNRLTPWFWGINGATSVCASVLAVVIALASGISRSYFSGIACYVVALIAFVIATRTAASGETAA